MKDRNIIDQIGEDVVLLDEDGKENTFEHILTFMYEGKKYVALSPIADEESAMDDDEAEVVLFQITSENGEGYLRQHRGQRGCCWTKYSPSFSTSWTR